VAKDTAKSKTKTRQPAKSRLSSSLEKTAKKATAKKAVKTKAKPASARKDKASTKTTKAKNLAVKKTAVKKTAAKKTPPAKKKTLAKKPSNRKKTVRKAKKPIRKAKRTRNINIPLGRKTRLTLTVKLSKSPAKKRGRKKTSRFKRFKKAIAKKRQFMVSLAMVLFGATGTVYFGLQVAAAPLPQGNDTPISQEIVVPTPTEKYLPRSEAKRLKIGAIDLNTKLISVGKNADGTMEVPESYDLAAYYKFGPTPGEKGPAVIVGHLDNYYSGPAVFWRLRELKAGDIISVDRADGKTAKFKVNSVKEFSQNSFPSKAVYGNIDHAGLRLITCGGSYDYIKQRYSDNTIVFASLVK
jgi:sortase (surface protein transpeptidase)